jgi:nuclear transport factor 2 (NTF2) superfamily protein
MKTILAFTSESYAYDKTELKAKQKLLNELKKKNRSASHCMVADVSSFNGLRICHEFSYEKDCFICETEDGEQIPFKTAELI